MNVVNYNVVFSLLWLLISIATCIFGIWHCRKYAFAYSLICDKHECTYLHNWDYDAKISFSREALTTYSIVRIENGKVVDKLLWHEMYKDRDNLHSFSMQIHVHSTSYHQEPTDLLFSTTHLGKHECRKGVEKLDAYISRLKDHLFIRSQHFITTIGILCFLGGISSAIAAICFGQWSDPTPRRLKKQS